MRITVLGGSGYAGSHLVREAARRGHDVTALSRSVPPERVDGVDYRELDVLEPGAELASFVRADALLDALSPRGVLDGRLESVRRDIAEAARHTGVRYGVIGGAGCLRTADDGPRVMDTAEYPAHFKHEAEEVARSLAHLRGTDAEVDWFFVSPPPAFGSTMHGPPRSGPDLPVARTGRYRLGGDVVVRDAAGVSTISAADLAVAVLDEVENPRHHRVRFTVAY